MTLYDTTVLNNLSGGVVDVTGGAAFESGWSGYTGGTFNNESGATFEDIGSNYSYDTVPFDNQSGGIIDVTAGEMYLGGGGTNTGGTFNVSSGATLDLTAGYATPTLTGTYTGSGGGTVALTGGGSLNIGDAGATFDFPAGMFQWSGGSINGPGTLDNTGTITIVSPTGKGFGNGLVLNNSGTIADMNNSGDLNFSDASVFNNLSGGLVNLIDGDSWGYDYDGGTINNETGATFEETGPYGSYNILPFNNTGTVETTGGNMTFTQVAQVSGTTLAGGTWIAAGTGQLTLPGGDFTENDGSVTLSGGGSFPQIDSLADNVGSFSLYDGASFTTVGDLQSPGNLELGPGGTLNVSGSLTLSSSSALGVQFGGSPASGQFGQLFVQNAVTIGGFLSLQPVGGYTPVAGQAFQIAGYSSETGAFSFVLTPYGNFMPFAVNVNQTYIDVNALDTVGPATTTTLSVSASTVTYGHTVNLTATVTGADLARGTISYLL